VTIRGGTRSLAARLGRLEERIPEPQGPVVYRAYFHDGTPLWPRSDGEAGAPSDEHPDVVYHIASWEESELNRVSAGTARQRGRANARW
jgi:hypothetical protein